MKQILAIDMDGTCLNRKHAISRENMEALHAAHKAGILVVPTTGRAASCIPLQLQADPFFRYIITSNGAYVTDIETKTAIYESRVPYGKVSPLLRACTKAHLGVSVHARHGFWVQGFWLNLMGRLMFGKDADNARHVRDIAGLLEQEQVDVEEIQLFFFTKKQRRSAEEILSREKDLLVASAANYAEAYPLSASKGRALEALARHLGIPKENIACIGDAENDLSMFEVSGLRFAMGNAIPKLKEQADHVVPSNDESGVAYAIRNYLLQEK